VSLFEEEEEEEDDENRETGYQEDVDDVSDEDPEMVLKEVIKTRSFNSITLSNKINLDQFFSFSFSSFFPSFLMQHCYASSKERFSIYW